MDLRDLTAFPVARYRLEWRASTPVQLPDYAGSMLRGAFGHALRQSACMTGEKDCGGCPLIAACPYASLFAPPPPPSHTLQKFNRIPVPYVIEPPDWGARLIGEGGAFSFHMVLVGRALAQLPLILLAWRRAFARGVGAGDGTAELMRVVHCGQSGESEIHRPETGAIVAHPQEITMGIDATEGAAQTECTLDFTTPLRLQKNGHALPAEQLDARTLLMALVRRASLLAEFHADRILTADFGALLAATSGIRDSKRLEWRDWTRFSSRQQQKMTLGGVVGRWTIRGPITPFVSFLRLGEWMHVGKETAFGLGRYTFHGPADNILAAGAESCERSLQVVGGKEEAW